MSEDRTGSNMDFLLAVDDLMAQAKVSHPSIVAAQAQLKAAQARVVSAEAEDRPTVSLTGARYLNGRPSTAVSNSTSSETTYGITVNIPLFDGFGRGAKINAARAQVAGKAAELSNTELQVSLEVWKAYQDLRSQSTTLDTSRDLLESTMQAYAAIQARYRVGAAGIVDVLNTQSAQANAQQQRVQTLGNWRAAQLKLLGSLGQLGLWAVQR